MKNLPKIDYQSAFDATPGMYIMLSTDFIIIDITESLCRSAMRKKEDLIGENLFDAFPDNPNDKNADGTSNLKASLNFVLKNKIPHTMAVQRYDVEKPDGDYEARYWSPYNKPVLDANGDVLFIIHRTEDVSEFIKLQDENTQYDIQSTELKARVKDMEIEIIKRSREIQQMNAELDQKVTERTNHLKEANETIKKNIEILTTQKKQLEDFCNIISHNLRAPLVNISMLVEMIAEIADDPEEKKVLIDKLNKTSQNLNDIFNELIESIQVGQDTEIPSKKLQFESYLQKTIVGLNGQINQTNAVIDWEFNDAPFVNYPPKYLYSILHNLLSNALKYHSSKRPPIIKVATKRINGSVILSVADNGLGIDLEKNKQHLFKIRKVFHSHPDAKGFGLFITKSQIEAMNGRIWIESSPDQGATFFVEFNNQHT